LFQLRAEREQDFAVIRTVLQEAFGTGSPEADLVDALRAAGAHVPELCLVAEFDGDIVGHVFFSRALLESGDEVLALAPMAVLPAFQRAGAGSELVREGLRRAGETDFPLVVVLGHPEYYPRFGFERADGYGVRAPWEVPPEAWMVYRLPAYRPEARGMVEYAEPFASVT
jgi:predicted N-acetyltransferase YhbS